MRELQFIVEIDFQLQFVEEGGLGGWIRFITWSILELKPGIMLHNQYILVKEKLETRRLNHPQPINRRLKKFCYLA